MQQPGEMNQGGVNTAGSTFQPAARQSKEHFLIWSSQEREQKHTSHSTGNQGYVTWFRADYTVWRSPTDTYYDLINGIFTQTNFKF